MKVKQITTFFLILLFGAVSSGFAKEVNIKEVKISLFNKPVMGYRLFLDKSNKTVTNQVLKHVGKYDHKPFQFERTIIFENIFYPPVTDRKEISLYYLLHDLPGGFSELTVVGMYDYKRSINTDEFPDLSLKLLADIAKLVDKISGDVIRFEDLVLDDEMLEELNSRLEEEALSDNIIEHFPEEEVENNSVLIKNDPFAGVGDDNGQSMGKKLADRINELDDREKRLLVMEEKFNIAQDELKVEKAYVEKMAGQNQSLRDSIVLLNRRLGSLVMSDLAGDGVSVSAEDHDAVTLLQDQLVEKQANTIRLVTENDSLKRSIGGFEKMLKLEKLESQGLTAELKEMRMAYADLKSEYMQFKSDLYANSGMDGNPDKEDFANSSMKEMEVRNNALADSLSRVNRKVGKLEGQLSKLAEKYALLESEGPDTVIIEKEADPVEVKSSDDDNQDGEMIALQAKINDLKDDNSSLKEDKKAMQAKLDASVSTLKNMEKTSKKLLAKVEAAQKEIAAQRAEQGTFEEMERLSSQRLKSARDSVQKLAKVNVRLKDRVKELDDAGKVEPAVVDSLNKQIRAQRKENKSLDLIVTRLRYRVDSLGSISKPATEQEAFLRQQRQDLAARNLEMQEKEKDFRNRQKLLDRREANFEDRQKAVEIREARLEILKGYETQLKLLEQRLKQQGAEELVDEIRKSMLGPDEEKPEARFSGTSADPILREEVEEGKKIQVFTFTINNGYRSTERKIASYMLYNGFLYDEKYPDLTYESVQMTRIHERPLEIKFRLKADGSDTEVKASFKIKGGPYIEPEENLQAYLQVKDYLKKLSRFNP